MHSQAFCSRIYRLIATLFPEEFKNAFGDEMQATADKAQPLIKKRFGVLGIVNFLLDVGIGSLRQQLSVLLRDIRYGLRALWRSPGFTAVALISLSLGICIATCADSEMNGIVLRNVPAVGNPDELVALQVPISYPNYRRYRDLHDAFSSTAAYVAPVPFTVSSQGENQRTWGHLVTNSYFSTLQVHPAMGRFFDQQEEMPTSAASAIVSYRFWQSHFGADRSIIGKTIQINGYPFTVIGVGPERFVGASPSLFVSDLWIPIAAGTRIAPELANNALEKPQLTTFQMIGRLRPGVTADKAEAELDGVARQLEILNGTPGREHDNERRVFLVPGGKVLPIRKEDRPLFTQFFLVLATLVLLIASANVANMMLARGAERRREIAIRLALGATRARLIQQLLTESMLVAIAAGIIGFACSVWIMRLASQLRMPLPIPVTYDLNVDVRAFFFALVVTTLTGLGFGILPALHSTRTDLTAALKDGGAVVLRRFRRINLRNVLLLSQIAGSLMLLLLVGLLAFGIQTTLGIEKGFDPNGLYVISLDPVREGYSGEKAADFLRKLLDRVQKLPAVTSATLTETVPVTFGGGPGVIFSTVGGNSHVSNWAERYAVGKDYFRTAGISIRAGRGFSREDESAERSGVIVTEELVRRYWKGEDPLGRRIEIRSDEISGGGGPLPSNIDVRPTVLAADRQTYEVIGVAADVTNDLVASKEHPAIYFPLRSSDYAEPSLRGMTFLVRGTPGSNVIESVRREISAMYPRMSTFNAHSMFQQIGEFMLPLRAAAWTYAFIGAFGLILASVGLAGITAYSVAQRRHEIGIRMALGAAPKNVLGLVMKEGVVLVVLGTIIGLAGAWAGLRLLAWNLSTIASTSTSNPALVVGIPALLATVVLAACFLPARKSLNVHPAVALRQE